MKSVSETFIDEVSSGRVTFQNIALSSGYIDKIQTLPMLSEIYQSDSFVLNDLSEVEKFGRLHIDQALRTVDEKLLLGFQTDDKDITFPATLLKPSKKLNLQINGQANSNTILGVFRERDGQIEQLSINEDYIKDGGKELQAIMENGLFEEIQPVTSKDFTAVLDTVYNIGVLDRKQINPDYQIAWEEFYQRYDKAGGNLEQVIREADREGLVDKQTDFYKEMIEDRIAAHSRMEGYVEQLDISQLTYALDDVPYADQLISQLPYGDLGNSPIGFTESSHDSRIGFISFDGMDSIEIENLSAWFEKLGVADSPREQVTLVEKWQKEIETLSEKVEQNISKVRDEYEKSQEEKQEMPLEKDTRTVARMIADKDTKALNEYLQEGMKSYLDSEQFKNFLDAMAKFHNYSVRNIHLLKMQNPNISHVAGFQTWRKEFERHVKKGEKGLKIWMPYQIKVKELDANGVEQETTETRYKLTTVFDISQTDGKELPKAINELTGDVKDYEDIYRAARAVSQDNGVPLQFEHIERYNTKGYYHPTENRIVISKDLKGQEQILKTIFHEMAHSELHRGSEAQFGDEQYRKQELQAEGVAYVVAAHYGFDTSQYSFGYLAIWSQGENGLEEMTNQLEVIQKEAKSLIARMDKKLEQVKSKSQHVAKDKFTEKLERAKMESEKQASKQGKPQQQVEEKKSLSSPN
ncbi:hypothetical protein STRDD10_00407 [Streptococcus sp. DD10]|uniref:ArdC-like ssDNA-binding domain-containing protein n=1 Tax=Streptococcus sp. DD10 TaxID=1777878 RepID=UPI0007972237|nr:PBECR4 domain-containing protein [Streptococcus sp. DD10]KXT75171.1 hypothetical protein STRDD10_00407 [Streptococcus sp. DD10]